MVSTRREAGLNFIGRLVGSGCSGKTHCELICRIKQFLSLLLAPTTNLQQARTISGIS